MNQLNVGIITSLNTDMDMCAGEGWKYCFSSISDDSFLHGADICKETQLKKDDSVTPVNWLPNVAIHLSGPSRTLGAVIIGSSGEEHVSVMCSAVKTMVTV